MKQFCIQISFKDEVDGKICGTWGTTLIHPHYIDQVIGERPGGSAS